MVVEVSEMEDIQVVCPCCKKRLLDVDSNTSGDSIIKIKCGVCKCLVAVSLHNREINTAQTSEPKLSWRKQAIYN
jgi:uncharacterized protein YbaR (Trm112 family)